ncbi:hypothetical protein L3Q82_007090 [Scortum barcoo]|uniref:Uncharacterized protein n=1 Tax=Scortum barcoo TaxID=214431 RepID=A0ACB8WSH7_9TELE|nr:hypothetical protein L3Q82_007090 [Scortum barcoo]
MSHREEALGEDPGHAGETMSLGWPGNASGSPRKSWRKCLGPLHPSVKSYSSISLLMLHLSGGPSSSELAKKKKNERRGQRSKKGHEEKETDRALHQNVGNDRSPGGKIHEIFHRSSSLGSAPTWHPDTRHQPSI